MRSSRGYIDRVHISNLLIAARDPVRTGNQYYTPKPLGAFLHFEEWYYFVHTNFQ